MPSDPKDPTRLNKNDAHTDSYKDDFKTSFLMLLGSKDNNLYNIFSNKKNIKYQVLSEYKNTML